MRFVEVEAPQRSPEWHQARVGRHTGSKAHCVLAQGKGGKEAVVRRDHRLDLACQLVTGLPGDEGFTNAAMARGIEEEPFAIAAYEAQTGNLVRKSGFLRHTDILVGCSLDGHVGEFEGIVEVKNPKTATHIGYLTNPAALEAEYSAQCWHNLWVTGAKWCDLVSFDRRLPEDLQLLVVRIGAGPEVEEYAQEALQFLREVETEVAHIRALRDARRG